MRHWVARWLGLSCVAVMAAPAGQLAKAAEAPVQMPRFEVRERRGICEFGLSIVTNVGVLFGGRIKWMRVGDVAAGSPAALAGLQTQDEIFLIDDVPLQDFNRRKMLEKFFGRPPGAKLSLMVRSGPSRLWRNIRLQTPLRPPL
jgi:C-terminal processing protease CtpA/Prc